MSTNHAATAVLPPPTIEDLGGGFHAFVQLDGSWGLNNAGVHVGERQERKPREAVGRAEGELARAI